METYRNRTTVEFRNAQRKVKKIKGFYTHAFIYLAVNLAIIAISFIRNNGFQEDGYGAAVLWGIGLAIHGLSVFGTQWILGRDWEERKINELLRK